MNLANNDDLLAFIKAEIESNRMVLPTLPDVAIEARAAVAKGDASANQLADIIATDTALSAKLIQVANSPLFRGRQEIEKLQIAVARLGNNTVRTLITSLAMQQIFTSSSQSVEQLFREIWEQSVNVSAISRALASYSKSLDPEQAMLAGLIHQIGKLPILMVASKETQLLEDNDRLKSALDSLHTQVGKIIMDAWEFPDSLRSVASDYTNFQRNISPAVDYVDVVQVAYLQNLHDTGLDEDDSDWNNIPAFAKLGLQPEVEILEIAGVSEEVEQAHALLA